MGYQKCCGLVLSLTVLCSIMQETQVLGLPFHRLQKFHVHIVNGLSRETLHAHCQSKNDDIGGVHDLSPTQEFQWNFKTSLLGNTVFHCHLWWKNGHHAFAAFDNGDKMYDMCGGKDCVWTAKEDGIYILNHKNQNYQFKFAWEKKNLNAGGGEPGVALT